MWVIAMFDLPVDTKGARRAYARFRKDLLEDGFTMMQFSVYIRHCASVDNAALHAARSLTLAYVLMAAQFTLIFAAMAHNFSLVQELSPANARGQASGLFALSAGVVPAFAPLLVGLISDRLGTGAEGLMLSIMGVSIPAYLLGALVLRSRSLGYADVIRDANEPATPV